VRNDSPPSTTIGLPQEPHAHNFPPWNFFKVEINGISLNALEPKHVKEWRDGDRAGWELRFNFDGVFLNLRFFMVPDSPLLWCEGALEPLAGVEVKKVLVQAWCYPGKMIGGHFQSDIYQRAVFTPERTLPLAEKPAPVPLTVNDRMVFFNDRKHLPPDGFGPCAVQLDWRCLDSAEVWAGSQFYCAKVSLNVNPAKRKFRLAFFSSKQVYQEEELLKFLNTVQVRKNRLLSR